MTLEQYLIKIVSSSKMVPRAFGNLFGYLSQMFRYAYEISEALIYVSVLMFPLYTTGLLGKIKTKSTNIKFNNIPGPVTKVIGFVLLFVAIALIRLLISKIIG